MGNNLQKYARIISIDAVIMAIMFVMIIRLNSDALILKYVGLQEELPLSRLIVELRGYNVVAGLCFMVTLFAFPGITASICSIRNPADTAPCASHAPGGRIYGASHLYTSVVDFHIPTTHVTSPLKSGRPLQCVFCFRGNSQWSWGLESFLVCVTPRFLCTLITDR